MLRYFSLVLCFVLGSAALDAANKEQDPLITGTPNNVPVSGRQFVAALEKSAPYNDSKRATR